MPSKTIRIATNFFAMELGQAIAAAEAGRLLADQKDSLQAILLRTRIPGHRSRLEARRPESRSSGRLGGSSCRRVLVCLVELSKAMGKGLFVGCHGKTGDQEELRVLAIISRVVLGIPRMVADDVLRERAPVLVGLVRTPPVGPVFIPAVGRLAGVRGVVIFRSKKSHQLRLQTSSVLTRHHDANKVPI